ncbi:hypothetical protein J6590_016913 [Homalodisca vitripennis]|nr:hypothetical protein J6590_016913 [Homalodisca vitripennis]
MVRTAVSRVHGLGVTAHSTTTKYEMLERRRWFGQLSISTGNGRARQCPESMVWGSPRTPQLLSMRCWKDEDDSVSFQ